MAKARATAILPPRCITQEEAFRVLTEIGPVCYDDYSIRVCLQRDTAPEAARNIAFALEELLAEAELTDNVQQFVIQVKIIPEKIHYG